MSVGTFDASDFYVPPLDTLRLEAARERHGHFNVIAPIEYVVVRKLEYYRASGSERHLRDVSLILTISAGLTRGSPPNPINPIDEERRGLPHRPHGRP